MCNFFSSFSVLSSFVCLFCVSYLEGRQGEVSFLWSGAAMRMDRENAWQQNALGHVEGCGVGDPSGNRLVGFNSACLLFVL